MKPEQRLHQKVRELLEPCDYCRVEGASSGFPDVNVARNGQTIWLELKVVTAGRTLLRKEQYAWGMRRQVHDATVYVLSWHEKLDEVFLWQYPLQVIPYSKYCQIISKPVMTDFSDPYHIISFLFP